MKTVSLPFKVKEPILACGADLKSAFAIAKADEAFLVDGFGDLADPDNLARYEGAVHSYVKKLGVRPKVIVCDLHPGYFSTKFAEAYARRPGTYAPYKVQHHEAHVAAAIIDGRIKGDVIGVAFDGTGFGSDGNIWGAEFFVGGLKGLKRVGHLAYIPMPGGEIAIKQPWRMAASYLYKALGPGFIKLKIELVKKLDKKSWAILQKMVDKGVNSPLTSSAGRLFDAVGSMVLARQDAAFEAELPIILEDFALDGCSDSYDFDLRKETGLLTIYVSRAVKGIVKDIVRKADISIISAKFHNTVAEMIASTALAVRKSVRSKKVVLTGGVFQNIYLIGKSIVLLKKRGFDVYIHSNIPTNDSGIPVGQIGMVGCRVCA